MAFSFQVASKQEVKGWTVLDGQNGLLGITVDHNLKASPKPRVLRHAQLALTGLPNAADWAQLANELGASRFPVMALLSRNEYQMFLVDKVTVRPEEMLQSLRWTLSTLLDYPPEEANLAWMDVPAKNPALNVSADSPPSSAKMHVVAVKSSLIDQRTRACRQAHLRLAVVDIRQTSQANLAQAVETPGSGVCLICADLLGLQITISFQGDLYLERFIRESLFEVGDASTSVARQFKFERIALEIQRSLDFVRRNFPALPVSLLYVGPTPSDIGLCDALAQRMTQPLQPLDLSTLFDWPEGSKLFKPEVQSLYFNALGASMRHTV